MGLCCSHISRAQKTAAVHCCPCFYGGPVGEEWSVRETDWDADPNLVIEKILLEDLEAKKQKPDW